jgi:hypothetical protein
MILLSFYYNYCFLSRFFCYLSSCFYRYCYKLLLLLETCCIVLQVFVSALTSIDSIQSRHAFFAVPRILTEVERRERGESEVRDRVYMALGISIGIAYCPGDY